MSTRQNPEPTDLPCRCGCTDRQVYRWWPHIQDFVKTDENCMIACEEYFSAVWAGES